MPTFAQLPTINNDLYEQNKQLIFSTCNDNSTTLAQNVLAELEKQQKDNLFDYTLKTYYEVLQQSKCDYKKIMQSMWVNDKVISSDFFFEHFKDNEQAYPDFIKGYRLSNDFRFANDTIDQMTLDQGINPELQIAMLDYIYKTSQVDYDTIVNANISHLEGHDLLSFVSSVKTRSGLNRFKDVLYEKINNGKSSAFTSYNLTEELLELKYDKDKIKNALENTRDIWERGNWVGKYRNLIDGNHLNVARSKGFYNSENKEERKTQLRQWLQDKIDRNELGPNPLLFTNQSLTPYPENELLEFLMEFTIDRLEYTNKEEGPKI